MPFSKTKKTYRYGYFGFILIMSALISCGQRVGSEIIVLDQATYNSYYHDLYKEDLELSKNETIIYSGGMQKVSTLAADIELENCRFRLSLIDGNQDGNYTSTEFDKIVLSPFGQDRVAIDLQRSSVGKMKERMFIQVDREWLLLSEIDSISKQMTITPWPSCPKADRSAILNTHWRPLEVRNENGELEYLNNDENKDKKQLIIIVRKPPLDDLLLQRIHDNKKEWAEDYELCVLYMTGYEKNQTKLYSDNSFQFPYYFTTKKSCKTINCHANPPYAFLLDRGGFILKEGIKELEIYQVLASK